MKLRKSMRNAAIGYASSMISVLLMAVVGWHSAKGDRLLTIFLIVGASLSIIGMGLRWLSHAGDHRAANPTDHS